MDFPARIGARLAMTLLCSMVMAGCATTAPLAERRDRDDRVGLASYYAGEHHGRVTASGERFDMDAMTGAHRSLPFGTRVRVTNLENGRRVVVRITDRGPFRRGRIIDLSYAAARRLRMVHEGTARVRLDVLAIASDSD